MKRSVLARIMALLLVFSLLPVNASAAIWDNWFNKSPQTSQSTDKKAEKEAEKAAKEAEKAAKKNNKKPGKEEKPAKPGKNEKPGKPGKDEPTEPEVTEPVVSDLTVVENAETADNGRLLRASTYTTGSGVATFAARAGEATGTTVKYFPVTMYDYDEDTINAATDALDSDLTLREGLYFSDGAPTYEKETGSVDLSAFVAGQYYIQNIRAADNSVGSWLYAKQTNYGYGSYAYSIESTANKADATVWTLVVESGKYYLKSGDLYLTIGSGENGESLTTTKTAITISAFTPNASGVQLSQNDVYLCQWGGTTVTVYGGYPVANDGGNGMRFYPVGSDTCIAPTVSETEVVSGYEVWNLWGYNSNEKVSQNKAYTGLVQSNLVNDQIVFNVNEGGIFDEDNTVKDIYTYVGLPFVLDTETGVYTFDSDVNGVYFADTDDDGNADPQSGTAVAPYNLTFDEGETQGWDGMNYGDGSKNIWAPFNTNSNDTGEGAINYHFGMRADLPFSMTTNGCVKSTDDESDPITFTFKGDDDVWVFIDGHLVIDLGGIHNRLGATVNFAENTITYFKPESNHKDLPIGSHNDPDFSITQKLFTEGNEKGIIPMTRAAFAADTDHEMEVFYLERGKGTSNAQIEFNLPMHDSVLVTKDATHSYTANTDKEDKLTAKEQEIVNNIDFGFTLYKNGDPVVNTNFYLQGRDVTGVVIRSTDASGRFTLKNGQTAKFITEIPSEGVTYYVVEDKVPDGFVSPDFDFAGQATYDYDYTGYNDGTYVDSTASAADASQIGTQIIPMPTKNEDGTLTWAENKSYEVTVSGSIEASDSIEFICSNFLDAELPNPTALAQEDIIVIDYGLPVKISPLANDNYRGDSAKIVYFGDDSVELTEETNSSTGVVSATWTGTKDFHSGDVVLNNDNTFTYTLNKQLTEVEVIYYGIEVEGRTTNTAGTELIQRDYAIGKIYIVPATVMYYEENFSDMVTFTNGNGVWDANAITNAEDESYYQEPGVVGTIGDSIYGSDVAYLSDGGDSNGTSRHGDTTNGAIRFQYTFTGTGTSIFARTSATTGYVQFKIYKGTDTTGEYMDIFYRDTYYKDTNNSGEDAGGTLYNIPIYTNEELTYGTYTVVATVAKAGTPTDGNVNGAGNDFYLDGIRVMQPLNYDDALAEKAEGAYAADGEASLSTLTLRQKLITDHEQYPEADETETIWPFAVLTDTNGEIIYASDYRSIGPKEEVYLNPGQSVSFSIKYWHQDGYQMHMGMKAPFGSAEVQVGQNTFDLNNAADCYYDITGMHSSVLTETDDEGYSYNVATYTFKAIDSIVSLTNIKITGNYEFKLVEFEDIEVPGDENYDIDLTSLEDLEEENTETPDVENTETETPEVEDTETPVVEDTETETPVVEDTETETPVVEDTETETPVVEETETETPVAQNTDSESDEVETTDVVETDKEA